VLQGARLTYFVRYNDPRSIRGCVSLRGCAVENAEDEAERGHPFVFKITVKLREERKIMYLQASSASEREKWLLTVQKASTLVGEDSDFLDADLDSSRSSWQKCVIS
jgi:hypothetical protein